MREKYMAKLLHIKNKCLYLYKEADNNLSNIISQLKKKSCVYRNKIQLNAKYWGVRVKKDVIIFDITENTLNLPRIIVRSISNLFKMQ